MFLIESRLAKFQQWVQTLTVTTTNITHHSSVKSSQCFSAFSADLPKLASATNGLTPCPLPRMLMVLPAPACCQSSCLHAACRLLLLFPAPARCQHCCAGMEWFRTAGSWMVVKQHSKGTDRGASHASGDAAAEHATCQDRFVSARQLASSSIAHLSAVMPTYNPLCQLPQPRPLSSLRLRHPARVSSPLSPVFIRQDGFQKGQRARLHGPKSEENHAG